MSDTVVLRQSRVGIAGAMLGCLAFIGLGVVLFLEATNMINLVEVHRVRDREGAGLFAGPLAVATFGWFLIANARRLADPRAMLTVDREGFELVSGVGRVRWRDVVGWEVIELGAADVIAVDIRDGDSFIRSRSSDQERESVESNLRVSGRPVLVLVKGIAGGNKAVLAAFENFSPYGVAGRRI